MEPHHLLRSSTAAPPGVQLVLERPASGGSLQHDARLQGWSFRRHSPLTYAVTHSVTLSSHLHSPQAETGLISQSFHDLGAPHLYRIIVTQDLPLLFDHLKRPSEISGVATKAQLLLQCRRMFVEYKQYGRESGYAELLRRNDWQLVGMTREERETRAVDEAHRDICGTAPDMPYDSLAYAIRKLSPRIMSRLQTLSMCALGDPYPVPWTEFYNRPRARAVHLQGLVTAAVRSFNIIHYCQQMTQENPLSLDLTDLSPPPPYRKATTAFVHVPPGAVEAPCVPWTTITCIYHDRMSFIKRNRLPRVAHFDLLIDTILALLRGALGIFAMSSMRSSQTAGDINPLPEHRTPGLSLRMFSSPGVGHVPEDFVDVLESDDHLQISPFRICIRLIRSLPLKQRNIETVLLAREQVQDDRRVIRHKMENWNSQLSPESLSEVDVEWGTIDEAPRFKETSFLDDDWDDYIEKHDQHDQHDF
jgi:hypothetical protein